MTVAGQSLLRGTDAYQNPMDATYAPHASAKWSGAATVSEPKQRKQRIAAGA
jgi:hypothetical protein